MIPKPDPQSFTRLLTSLGVFLCIVAFVGPGLVLRETSVLRVSSKELAGLTPRARRELERRQRVAECVGEAAPYVGATLLVAGLVLLGTALPRLLKQEGAEEARSTAELDKLRADLKPQDASDRKEALARELQEAVVAEEVSVEVLEARAGNEQTESERSTDRDEHEARPDRLLERMRARRNQMLAVQGIERDVLRHLSTLVPPFYELRTEVKLDYPSGQTLLLDGLLYSDRDQLADVIIEIKVVPPERFRRNLRNATDAALALRSRYAARTGRSTLLWLIVVVDAEEPPASHYRRVLRGVLLELPDTVSSVILRNQIDTLELPRHIRP